MFEGSDVGDEDEEGFEYDDAASLRPESGGRAVEGIEEPLFDRHAAASAIRHVDHSKLYSSRKHIDLGEDLSPPRAAYAGGGRRKKQKEKEKGGGGKARGWSHGSESSGGNRSALAGWLEAIKFGGTGGSGSATSVAASDMVRTPGTGTGASTAGAGSRPGSRAGLPSFALGHGLGLRSNRESRTSMRSDEARDRSMSLGGLQMNMSKASEFDKWYVFWSSFFFIKRWQLNKGIFL